MQGQTSGGRALPSDQMVAGSEGGHIAPGGWFRTPYGGTVWDRLPRGVTAVGRQAVAGSVYRARSSPLTSLPVALRGSSSVKSTLRGTL